MRRSIKFFFIFVAFIMLALLAFVATFDANNYKPQIIEQVENATGRTFTIDGDINLSIFPWIGLKVEGVALGNEKGFKAKQFAAIKQLDVKINVLPLLKKEVEINTIRLHGLNVSLEVAEDKSNNWSGLSQPAAEGEGDETSEPVGDKQQPAEKDDVSPLQSLKIEGFEFVDAVIRYDDRSSDTKATVSELNLTTGAITFDEAIDVQFSARIENNQPVIDTRLNLSTQLTFNKELTRFNLRDFVFTVLAKANEFVPQQEKIEIKSDIDVSMDEQRVILKQLQLSALGTTTIADITISQFLQTPVIQGGIEVQPFNAREIAKRVAVVLPEMAKADALHRVSLKTKIKLQGEKFQANDFNLVLDGNTLSGWIHVLNLTKQQLRYDLAFDQLNINDYMPPEVAQPATESNAAAGVAAPSENAASGDEKIELPVEMMRKLDIEGDFKIASLTAKEYQIKQFLMTVKAHKGLINIKPLAMQVLQGQVGAAVKVDVQKEKPEYAINLKVNQVQVGPVANPVLAGMMGDKPLKMQGAINLKMDVKTTGESVNQLKKASKGQIVFDMKETAIHGFDPEFYMRSSIADYVDSKGFGLSKTIMSNYRPRDVTVFDKIHSTINLANGKARTDDFLMSAERVKVTAKGHVDIMRDTLDVITSVRLPRSKTVAEKIFDEPVFVHVFGPFDALEYKLDTDRLKKSTTDVLKKQAKAKIDAEKQRLKAKADAEKKRLKAKLDEEKRRAEEKARQELKKSTDKYQDKLKDKLKGLF
ncbi:MAG: AsmA family protein [Gammaproteobacteria bacterium]|nr:AsmA family protein [Gammaproteobacteria bacterium]